MTDRPERLLWQGRPDPTLRFDIRSPVEFAIGLACLGGPLPPALLIALSGSHGWLIFLPVWAAGLWFLWGWCLWDGLRRRVTRYYLSDQRIVIDRLWPLWPRRYVLPLAEARDIALDPPHIWVDQAAGPTWDGRAPPKIGFEYLDDAPRVADQMRQAHWALTLAAKAPTRD